jgi:mRNA interferase MazF
MGDPKKFRAALNYEKLASVMHAPALLRVLVDWKAAGLNVASAVKRGFYTVHQSLVVTAIGKLSSADASSLETSLRDWLDIH